MLKFNKYQAPTTHRLYHYFDVAVGRWWSSDSGTCAGCNVAIGETFSVRQVKCDDPDENVYLGRSGRGWALG
jgi:hypothetical protein